MRRAPHEGQMPRCSQILASPTLLTGVSSSTATSPTSLWPPTSHARLVVGVESPRRMVGVDECPSRAALLALRGRVQRLASVRRRTDSKACHRLPLKPMEVMESTSRPQESDPAIGEESGDWRGKSKGYCNEDFHSFTGVNNALCTPSRSSYCRREP